MGVRTNSLPGRESVTFLRTDREPPAPREQGHAAKNTVGERARPAALEWKLARPELGRQPRFPAVADSRRWKAGLFPRMAANGRRRELAQSARSRRLLRAYGSAEQRTVRRFGTPRSDRRPESAMSWWQP